MDFNYRGQHFILRNVGKQGLKLTLHAPYNSENEDTFSLIQNAPYLLNYKDLTPNPIPEFMDERVDWVEHKFRHGIPQGELFQTLFKVTTLHPVVTDVTLERDGESVEMEGGMVYDEDGRVIYSDRRNGVSIKFGPNYIGVLCLTDQTPDLQPGQVTGNLFQKAGLTDVEVTVTGAPKEDPYRLHETPQFALRFDIVPSELSSTLSSGTLDNLLDYLIDGLPEDKDQLFQTYESLNRTQVDVSDLDQLNQQTR